MASSNHPPRDQVDGASPLASRRNVRSAAPPFQSSQSTGVLRRNDESWVEISSQPSSSSLSSIGDEIVTTGLRVQNDRRRRRGANLPSQLALAARNEGTSSQEEYDETESEDDHVLSSSNENISPTRLPPPERQPYDGGSESEDDDDDENATALGIAPNQSTFRPQPNAFSHPPSSQGPPFHRYATDSNINRSPNSQASSRPAYARARTHQTASHSPNSNIQADHDEALRASLTTLLSCAAAARGLPKRPTHYTQHSNPLEATAGRSTGSPNMEIRMVPESELTRHTANSSRPMSPSNRGARMSPPASHDEKGKRKVSTGAKSASTQQTRALKKKKAAPVEETTMLISPTLMAWVVGAGVMVLVSVVGFGAGFVIGREVGHQEALGGLNGSSIPQDAGTCGREVARGGLRRLKWGGGMKSLVVA